MASGPVYTPNLFSSLPYDPNDPNDPNALNTINTLRLPVPTVSPQFQEAQLRYGAAPSQAVGPIDIGDRGPVVVNALPGQPNISNPITGYTGGQGANFERTFSDGGYLPNQFPADQFSPPPQSPPDAMPGRASQYADAAPSYSGYPQSAYAQLAQNGDYPSTTGSVASTPAQKPERSFADKWKEAMAWIAPPANAQAALGYANAADKRDQNASDNVREDAKLALAKAKAEQDLRQAMVGKSSVSQSANGKWNIITTTNPVTGAVSFKRVAIPEDEQDLSKAEGKDPSGILQRDLTANLQTISRNGQTLNEADHTLDNITSGKVDFSGPSQLGGAVGNYLGVSSDNARNIASAQRTLQTLVEDRMNMEKGGGSNEKLKQVMAQVIPQGSAYYDTKQWEEAIRTQRRLLAERTAAVYDGTASTMRNNARLAADLDPVTGKPMHETYAAKAAQIRAEQAQRESAWAHGGSASAPATPAAPARVTSPLMNGLQSRFGTPGGQ